MGWRMGAAWALIGFATQCLLAVLGRKSFADGILTALFHYFVWGGIGYLLGTVLEHVTESSCRNYISRQAPTEPREPQASSSAPRPT